MFPRNIILEDKTDFYGLLMKNFLTTLAVAVLAVASGIAQAVTYDCRVDKKVEPGFEYSKKQVSEGMFSVLIKDGAQPTLSRCSFAPSQKKVTCDEYAVDKTVENENVGIKKYYVFKSQFDVQIFSSLRFVENNGRGGIAFGQCAVLKP